MLIDIGAQLIKALMAFQRLKLKQIAMVYQDKAYLVSRRATIRLI